MTSSRLASILSLLLALALSMSGCGSDTTAGIPDADESATDVEDHDEEDGDDHDEDEDDHDDEDGGGLGAHEHGAAELSVAWSGGDMIIDLITPTFNVFGFEYEPSSEDDLAIVADRTEALSAPEVMVINDEAACTLADDVMTELEFEGSHAELTASWLFTCENPDEIAQLDMSKLFAEFPNLEDLDAEWVSATAQSSAELSPTSTVLNFEG